MPRFLPGSHSRLPCLPTWIDRVRAELLLEPAVDGQVVVRRSKIRIVVDRDRVLAEPARRLDQDHHVARLQRGGHDLAVGIRGCGRRTARRAPRPRPRSRHRQDHRAGRPASAGTSPPGSAPAGRPAARRSATPDPDRRRRSARGSARCRRWCRAPRRRRARAGPVPGIAPRLAEVVARRRASPGAAGSTETGVSSPTALPIRECLVG